MRFKLSRALLAVGILVIVFCLGWIVTYPDAADPKGIRYVFWKWGFHSLNPDTALEAMVGDPDRESVVIGKSKDQLRSRFGYLLPVSKAYPYLQHCYQNSPWKNSRDVLFIRNSWYLVRFSNGKAIGLELAKGC